MRARVFPKYKMAASTVYKHRVLDVAILHPGNTHALIGKFCNYVLGRTFFREWIYGDWSPYIYSLHDVSIPEMKFCHVHSYKTSQWGHVCSLSDNPLPACSGENLLPLVIIVSMCKMFSWERVTRVTLYPLYKNIVLNGWFSEKSVINKFFFFLMSEYGAFTWFSEIPFLDINNNVNVKVQIQWTLVYCAEL